MVLVNQKGALHFGRGTRWSKSCSKPNGHAQPQTILFEAKPMASNTTNITTPESAVACRDGRSPGCCVPAIRWRKLRRKATGLGSSCSVVVWPKKKPKNNTPPIRKASLVFVVTRRRRRSNVATSTTTSHARGLAINIGENSPSTLITPVQ